MSEERWQLVFVVSPERIVGELLMATAPDTLMRINRSVGVPADAQFIRAFLDDCTQRVHVVLAHPSFKGAYEAQGLCNSMIPLYAPLVYSTAYTGVGVRSVIAGVSESSDDGASVVPLYQCPSCESLWREDELLTDSRCPGCNWQINRKLDRAKEQGC